MPACIVEGLDTTIVLKYWLFISVLFDMPWSFRWNRISLRATALKFQ